MAFIRLTAIPHPDINEGKSYPVYVDSEHIVLIERGKTSQEKWAWRDQQHDAVSRFWDEVQRIDGEIRANVGKLVPDNEEEMKETRVWAQRRDIASSINAAYGIVNQMSQQPARYPAVECTCIQLAVPNARFTMLPAVFVTETPEQVAQLLSWQPAPHYQSNAYQTG